MERISVHIGVNCNGAQSQFFTRPDDSNRDLSTVCDEDFVDFSSHGGEDYHR